MTSKAGLLRAKLNPDRPALAMAAHNPLAAKLAAEAGFDAIWFGCYVVVIVGMGGVTPPVGMSCYILGGMLKDVPLMTIFKGSVPYVIAYFAMAIILALVPGIATWLPNLIMG